LTSKSRAPDDSQGGGVEDLGVASDPACLVGPGVRPRAWRGWRIGRIGPASWPHQMPAAVEAVLLDLRLVFELAKRRSCRCPHRRRIPVRRLRGAA